MEQQQARVHHYVPRWYQRRFLQAGQFKFYYLNLHPTIVYSNGVRHERRALLPWGPDRCFCEDDLYTVSLGNLTTDDLEKRFFGVIDSRGRDAVKLFGDYNGLKPDQNVPEAFHNLVQYMDAQRFRTPRGLDWLRKTSNLRSNTETLMFMQRAFRFHTTMWAEGVWEIARARESRTKFIVTDEPVTFFNPRGFPRKWPYPEDVGLEMVGTRTLFPLSLDACLIITHTQFVRNPKMDPMAQRPNARAYQQTLRNLLDTQFGRELEEDEVLRINLILKKRATRYIAAAEEEWLYPEQHVSTTHWVMLDDDWFLLPHLYKVPFTSEIIMGRTDGSSFAMDEYGRTPSNPQYRDEALREIEWTTHELAKREWARKREGRSLAHVDEMRHDGVADAIMQEYLASEAAKAPSDANSTEGAAATPASS